MYILSSYIIYKFKVSGISKAFIFGFFDGFYCRFDFMIKAVRFPILAWSQAPFTAPQLVCPNTTINLVPASLDANSILPKISSFTKFPAIRILKISPKPWSKINSADTLESIQLKMVAKGKLSFTGIIDLFE